MAADFDWVFFDCFNTLIDDFDAAGGEAGLGPLPDLAVAMGFFEQRDEFEAAYNSARKTGSAGGREINLDRRLEHALADSPTKPNDQRIAKAVAQMLELWEDQYAHLIRPAPGVGEMLAHWSPRKQLGVITNFYLPFHPAHYLRSFQLEAHFQFILDSAEFGYRKPHPSIFIEALHRAGLPASQAHRVLVVGDRVEFDLEPAAALGMQTLYFNRRRTRPNAAPTPEHIRAIYDWSEFR